MILPTLIAFERGCTYRKYVEQWYAGTASSRPACSNSGSYHAIVACVAAGAGIAVAPRSVLDLQPETGNITAHVIPELEGIDTLLAWRQGLCVGRVGRVARCAHRGRTAGGRCGKPPVTVPA